MLPAKVFRKVQDDGRSEFTLSRTRANWRRLTLLRDATAPARRLFDHLCSWSNPWHSGGCYCAILLFGVFPSRVSVQCGGTLWWLVLSQHILVWGSPTLLCCPVLPVQ
jgi:hypothetical protein